MSLFNAIANAVWQSYDGKAASSGFSGDADLPRLLTRGEPSAPMGSVRAVTTTTRADAVKPVLQFCSLPITIDVEDYKNPRSGANPNGDLKALYAFRELVDPLPSFTASYIPTNESTEMVYGQIVSNATSEAGNSFTAAVIAESQKMFRDNTFSDMDGTPGTWNPVYAVPNDWYDTVQPGRFQKMDLDLDGDGDDDAPFTVLGKREALALSVGKSDTKPLDAGTKVHGVTMEYLMVSFRRPWLNSLLFESWGWYLQGQPKGFCSSGKSDQNRGVFPLLPIGMLLGRKASVVADWSEVDQARIDRARASNAPAFLGPLALDWGTSGASLNVVGWVSTIVPLSPPMKG